MTEQHNLDSKGDVSDWNEGNFKSMRLHKAQILINIGKSNSLKKLLLPDFYPDYKWGYEIWYDGIHIMEGEGNQLYNSKESEEVKDLKDNLEKIIGEPICNSQQNYSHKWINVNLDKWKVLKEKLEEFEYLVKKLNSKHGLATKLMGTKGLF